ncbi:hypothetical protein [Actinomadura kijaniata]|uniref:hypothetical protein n=1 Tax=Actinomadura kijaniata TaxID=46161 RepID=UPI000ABBCAE6|nr:hypothetical protein [Actinomadura kijaniata]
MRRVVSVTIVSGALVGGLFAAGPAAQAETRTKVQPAAAQDDFGKEVTVTREGAISGAALINEAKRAGRPYSAKEAAAIKAAPCRVYERTRGYKNSKGRWLIKVTNRLTWCWNGSQVLSYRANWKATTANKKVWRMRGWVKKSAAPTKSWSSVTSKAQYRFYYTGNRKTYSPWVNVTGYRNGAYRWSAGG